MIEPCIDCVDVVRSNPTLTRGFTAVGGEAVLLMLLL